ncbi:MAG TPA: hypothetical protein VJQ42_06555 [Rhodanobacteraceae bacterium]|nr:hypothetical protein [Rhodanobacteraceae bacterium]
MLCGLIAANISEIMLDANGSVLAMPPAFRTCQALIKPAQADPWPRAPGTTMLDVPEQQDSKEGHKDE